MDKQFKYKTCFSSVIKPIVSEERDKYLAKASLEQLKNFLPQIDIERNIDLLPVSFSAFVAGRTNKNDDTVYNIDAISTCPLWTWKFIDLEHRRSHILGCILNSGFSEFGSEKPLTLDEVKSLKGPFNITLGGVVWKLANKQVTALLEECCDPSSDKFMAISASFELAFDEFDIGILRNGDKNIENAEIISEPSKIQQLESKLKAFGGTGKLDKNERLIRIVKGTILPLGVAITENPAANVKGILAQTENNEQPAEISNSSTIVNLDNKDISNIIKDKVIETIKEQQNNLLADKTDNSVENLNILDIINLFNDSKVREDMIEKYQLVANSNKNKNNSSQISNCDVIQDNELNKSMKLTIKDINDANLKEIKAADVQLLIEEEIKKASEKYVVDKTAHEVAVNELKAKNEEVNKSFEKTKKDLEAMSKQLAELKAEADERAANEQFSSRMATFDEQYDLDADEKKEIAADIKSLDDNSFTAYAKKMAVFFKNKKKGKKADKENAKEDGAPDEESDAKKTAKANEILANDKTEKEKVVDDAIDNGKVITAKLPNTTSATTQSLKDKYKNAFTLGDGINLVKR